jgi:hypothetical protein
MAHALEHIYSFIHGDSSEDHLGHALWNIGAAIHYMTHNPSMDDRAPYAQHVESVVEDDNLGSGPLDYISVGGQIWYSAKQPDEIVEPIDHEAAIVASMGRLAAGCPGGQVPCAARKIDCTDCCDSGEVGDGCRLCGKVANT